MTPEPTGTTASPLPGTAPLAVGSAAIGGDEAGRPSLRRFAGWRILAIAVATTILTGPGQTIGVSVFIDPMVNALGVTRSTLSAAYLVGTLVGALVLPIFGRFVDRRGVRLAQMLVGAGFALALVNMAGVRNTVWLVFGFAGIRMLGQGALSLIPSVAVSLWFDRRRGVALGILTTVGGAGMALVPLVLNTAIEATSWRVAWLLAAGVIAVTVIPLARFGLINRPADIGQFPDGIAPTGPSSTTPDQAETEAGSYTRGEAIRTRQFWVLAAVGTASGMLITGLNFHQIDLLGDAGLDAGLAAAMFLPQIIGSSVMAIGIGFVVDRIGLRFVPAFAMVLLVLVHVLAASVQPGLVVVLYAVSLGAAGGATRAAISTLLPSYFGTANIGSIQGVMTLTGVAGSAAGPVTLAVTEAQLGGYRTANLVLMVIPILILLFALANRPLSPRSP